MWAFRCTLSVSNSPFSLNVKGRFGSFGKTRFWDRLDAELSSSMGLLFVLDRVGGPLEEENSRLDAPIDEADPVTSVDFPCFI
jgi:hypothetical protein